MAWREESGRVVRAEAKAEVVMGIVSVAAGADDDNDDGDDTEAAEGRVWLLVVLLLDIDLFDIIEGERRLWVLLTC